MEVIYHRLIQKDLSEALDYYESEGGPTLTTSCFGSLGSRYGSMFFGMTVAIRAMAYVATENQEGRKGRTRTRGRTSGRIVVLVREEF